MPLWAEMPPASCEACDAVCTNPARGSDTLRGVTKRHVELRAMAAGGVMIASAACTALVSLDGLSGKVRDAGADGAARADSDVAKETGVVDALPPPAFCEPAPGLGACFDFEDDAKDQSPNAFTPLTAQNVGFAPGVFGRAVQLTSAPVSYLLYPAAKSLESTSYTVEAFVMPTKLPAPTKRAGIMDTDSRVSAFYYDDATIHCRGGPQELVSPKVALDAWTHFACVWTPAGGTMYVDGVATSNYAGTGPSDGADSQLIIGGNLPTLDENFDGRVDRLRIWTVARSPGEVRDAARR